VESIGPGIVDVRENPDKSDMGRSSPLIMRFMVAAQRGIAGLVVSFCIGIIEVVRPARGGWLHRTARERGEVAVEERLLPSIPDQKPVLWKPQKLTGHRALAPNIQISSRRRLTAAKQRIASESHNKDGRVERGQIWLSGSLFETDGDPFRGSFMDVRSDSEMSAPVEPCIVIAVRCTERLFVEGSVQVEETQWLLFWEVAEMCACESIEAYQEGALRGVDGVPIPSPNKRSYGAKPHLL
jgi:hypothetical protein